MVKTKSWSKIFLDPKKSCKKLGPKRLVKVGSITAEIFLIWTLAARTNVAVPNVTTAVSIC